MVRLLPNAAPQYSYQYANEAAWREDHGRTDNGGQFKKLATAALHSPVSWIWKGYWQRVA